MDSGILLSHKNNSQNLFFPFLQIKLYNEKFIHFNQIKKKKLLLRHVHNQEHSKCSRAVSNDASKTQEKKLLNVFKWRQYSI